MTDFFGRLFDTDFMPHVYCLRANGLVWLHAISDALIAIAYLLIPFGLVRLLQKRRDLVFHWLFVLFAIFILSCGATHVLAIITLWTPIYRFDGLVKVITALASLPTAILLIRLIPQIAQLPSPEQWRRSNEELKAEIAQRKSAEAALLVLNLDLETRVDERTRELEEQNFKLRELKTAWDLAHGMIRDLKGKINFWCEGSEQLYGWKKQEAVGKSSHELLQTRFPKPLVEIEAELEERNTWSGELIHIDKSGAKLHIATHWVLQRDEAGKSTSVIEVNNDISDRLRAEEASRRLAEIVESSTDAIISSTLDGVVTSWNTSAEALFGYSAAEMIGEPLDRLTPATLLKGEQELTARVGQGAGAHRRETVRLTKAGKSVTVSLAISPVRNALGLVIGTSQIIRDISEAKARDEAFRVSEERQRLAVEAGQVGLWFMDLETRRCIWTQRCKELHGLAADAEVPLYPDLLWLVHSDDRETLQNAIRRTVETDADFAMEYRTRGRDYKTKWLQAEGRAQRDSRGRISGIHGTVIDLTARREMEDKLRRANTELEQFAYAAAHDLQEPLRNVALAAALLQKDGIAQDQDGQPKLLNIVVDNALRMEAMVKDLLAYSRSLDGVDDHRTTVDGSAVLCKALQNLNAAIVEKCAEVTHDRIPQVSMPESHLLQVLQNLIGNALKYTGSAPPCIHIGAKARSEDVLLFVRDNGVGIAPQFHDRAFRMFKRLHDGSIKGTGIGLAVCKRIVEHYGGQIWIESEAGEGATLFFTVPSTSTIE